MKLLGAICMLAGLALPIAALFMKLEIALPLVVLTVVFFGGGLALYNIDTFITVSRAARKLIPGASKEISGETKVLKQIKRKK